MERDLNHENKIYEKARAKAKTTLLWFGVFTVVMFFAGLTSAFVVSRGDGFWVSLQLPPSLIYSTITIAISSITMILAVRAIKQNNSSQSSIFLIATLVLGLLFGFFQYKGWGEIYEKGYTLSDNILNPLNTDEFQVKGKYGEDFTLFYGGKELTYENNQFYYMGNKAIEIDEEEYNEYSQSKPEMVFGSKLIELKKGEVQDKKTKKLKTEYVAVVLAKTNLTPNQEADLADQGNVSASYFYVLTVAHLLHVIFTLLYLLFMIFKTVQGKFSKDNYLQIKLGGYFWHFLGGLWVYLFLFLYLIH